MANQDYKKIPVKPDVYEKVFTIALANGFGERGLGAQVAAWAERAMPKCGHELERVTIETFPTAADGLPVSKVVHG